MKATKISSQNSRSPRRKSKLEPPEYEQRGLHVTVRLLRARHRRQAECFMLVICLTYSSTLKREAQRSSEMSEDFCRTIWHYISKDSNLITDFVRGEIHVILH
jgi:hypothetical protein